MASQSSLSESLQASIILRQQDHQRQQMHGGDEEPKKGIGFCLQLMMVSALLGIEMCMSFEQIYGILILQYFGVPKALLSLGGVICGCTSLIAVPTIGFITDRGPNPTREIFFYFLISFLVVLAVYGILIIHIPEEDEGKRKMISLYIAMTLVLSGLTCLAICGFIKIASMETILPGAISVNNFSLLSTTINYSRKSLLYLNQSSTTNPEFEYVSPDSIFLVPLSIAAFAFIDIGYDTSMSLTRAYVLECSPKFQHVKVLVIATVMQSLGGCLLSFVGVFDFPGTLEFIFQVDGIAATVIFFCFFLTLVTVSSFILTTLTGYFVTRKYNSLNIYQAEETVKKRPNRIRSFLKPGENKQSETVSSRKRPYNPDILHTDDARSITKPLLFEDSLKGYRYVEMEVSTSSMKFTNFDSTPEAQSEINSESLHNPRLSPVLETKTCSSTVRTDGNKKNMAREVENGSTLVKERDNHNVYKTEDSQSPKDPSNPKSVQQLISSLSNAVGKFSTKKGNGEKLQQSQDMKVAGELERKSLQRKMKIKLTLLSLSTFFAMGLLLGFVLYIANVLTIAIYKGDPQALPGTKEKELYEKGLQTAAIGTMALYITYTLLSMNNKRTINFLGEKLEYVVYLSIFLAALLSLIVSQREEAYFVVMVTGGLMRTAIFTLPFILAHKFTEEGEMDIKEDNKKTNVGKMMSLIGTLMACQYIFLSSLVGPLMEAVNDVWVPIFYSFTCGVLSIIFFLPLFVIK